MNYIKLLIIFLGLSCNNGFKNINNELKVIAIQTKKERLPRINYIKSAILIGCYDIKTLNLNKFEGSEKSRIIKLFKKGPINFKEISSEELKKIEDTLISLYEKKLNEKKLKNLKISWDNIKIIEHIDNQIFIIENSDFNQGIEKDIRLLRNLLEKKGFEVILLLNKSSEEINTSLEDFYKKDAEFKILYYTGHGIKGEKCKEMIRPKNGYLPLPKISEMGRANKIYIITDKCSSFRKNEVSKFLCLDCIDQFIDRIRSMNGGYNSDSDSDSNIDLKKDSILKNPRIFINNTLKVLKKFKTEDKEAKIKIEEFTSFLENNKNIEGSRVYAHHPKATKELREKLKKEYKEFKSVNGKIEKFYISAKDHVKKISEFKSKEDGELLEKLKGLIENDLEIKYFNLSYYLEGIEAPIYDINECIKELEEYEPGILRHKLPCGKRYFHYLKDILDNINKKLNHDSKFDMPLDELKELLDKINELENLIERGIYPFLKNIISRLSKYRDISSCDSDSSCDGEDEFKNTKNSLECMKEHVEELRSYNKNLQEIYDIKISKTNVQFLGKECPKLIKEITSFKGDSLMIKANQGYTAEAGIKGSKMTRKLLKSNNFKKLLGKSFLEKEEEILESLEKEMEKLLSDGTNNLKVVHKYS